MRENAKFGLEPLPEREAEVLRGVMEVYFATGAPVGSRTVAERSPDGPSPATVRNICAELEAAGYLTQPHTSAGRVPTAKSIRWWLQTLHAPQPLAGDDGERFTRALLASGDEASVWQRASEFLAEITGQVGVVAVQPWRDAGLKQLRFLRLTDHRVLAIWIATDGQVRERVSRVPEAYSQAELDSAARYFNTHFAGFTLARIRRELLRRIEEERAAYDGLLKRVLVLSHCGVLELQDRGEVYFQGADHLASVLEGRKLGEMLARLNQKERWLHLLTEAGGEDTVSWQAGDEPGVLPLRWIRVRVGLEEEQMPDFSLITTAWDQGAAAILGTTRMEYPTALSAISLVGAVLHQWQGEASA